MKQEKKTLSYYRLRLEVYLKDYHPQLLGVTKRLSVNVPKLLQKRTKKPSCKTIPSA